MALLIFATFLAGLGLQVQAAEFPADENVITNIDGSMEIQADQQTHGLIGFEDEYELKSDSSPVSVIVLFEHEPAAVQIAEALDDGFMLPESTAEKIVEDDHALFRRELNALFGGELQGRTFAPFSASPSYEIQWEYRIALNGVNIVLPSNMVAEVAGFASVRAIIPDFIMEFEPPPVAEPVVLAADPDSTGNPVGMRPGRETMRADELHNLNYRGEGVVVAVLDTGIYYQHEAFQGAFPTIAEMQSRGVSVTNADGINIGGTYYFVGRNFFQGLNEKPSNDPSEVDLGTPLPATASRPANTGTDHGTHVAGTILGREGNGSRAILGVAPEAKLFVYRMLSGTTGSSVTAGGTIAAIERTVLDKADVVNMSFGAPGQNMATALTSISVNNVMLANPDMVFVASGGNSGPNYYTLTSPGPGTKYITAANINTGANALTGSYFTNPGQWSVASSSSRGPAAESYEVTPNLGAHGTNVLSAVPPWTAASGYAGMSGTSMSAPHIAGAAALLVEYSRRNGGQWPAADIKNRMMNNAMPFGTNVGVFDTGAGYVDVFAAATADIVVCVTYDKVITQAGVPYANQPSFPTQTGSLSFGSVNRFYNETMNDTMQVSITNRGNSLKTYTISREFTRNPSNAASLNLGSSSVPVSAGATAQFTAVMVIGSGAPLGFYEGFITVSDGSTLVARLPFAAVVMETRIANVSDEAALRAAVAGAGSVPTRIYLSDNITLTETPSALVIPGGSQITLRSPIGVTYALAAGGNYDVATVSTGAYLTIDGVNITRTPGTNGRGITNSGNLTLIDGIVSGHTLPARPVDSPLNTDRGGGILSSGNFIMEGGEISGNTASGIGGGVVVSGTASTFTMRGGVIQNNTTQSSGGGVFNFSVFAMEDGLIYDNTATEQGGGVQNQGTVTMHGGIIDNNTAATAGGGVHNRAVFTMDGGTISNNTVTGSGGGVHNSTGGTFTMNGGEISGNVAAVNGGGIGFNSGQLSTVQVGIAAVFENNSAGSARNRPASDNALYAANILGTRWTDPFTQGVNNYDIFSGGATVNIRELRFELNGTDSVPTDPLAIQTIRVIAGTPIMQAPRFPAEEPARAEHTFDGWHLNAGLSQPVTAATAMPNSNTALHASWIAHTYGIGLSQTDTYMFGAVQYGYEPQTAHGIIITNTGNQPTGPLDIALSGDNPGAFTLSKTSVAGIAADSSDNFTIVPNVGLSPGTYTALVTVSGGNNITASFPVSFMVEHKVLLIDVLISDKAYDGLTNATVFSANLNGIVGNDDVYLITPYPAASFTDSAAGNGITVTFSGNFLLGGIAEGNYTLAQPTGVTGNILEGFTPVLDSEYTISAANTGLAGGWRSNDFVISASDGFELSETNTAGGTWAQTLIYTTGRGNAIFYVRNIDTREISIAVYEEYKIDKTAPAGTITIKSNDFTAFLNSITFGLFFKNTVDVTIIGADSDSGVKTVEYLHSGTFYANEDDLKTLPAEMWTVANRDSVSFSISPVWKGYIYARITDNADNVTVIRSDGVVVYTDSSAVTQSIHHTIGGGDKTAEVNLNGNTIAGIANVTAFTSLELDTHYTVLDNEITFFAEYLNSLAPSETPYTLTVSYNPMGEIYIAGTDNNAPVSTTIELTVSLPQLDGTATVSGTSAIGQQLMVNTSLILGGSGDFSYQWQADGTNIGTNSATYVIQGADSGKIIICIVTRADATGSVTATLGGGVVPFNVTVTNIGNAAGDTPVTLSASTGRADDTITLNYVLGSGGTANSTLTFTGGTGLVTVMAAGASTSQAYTVYSGDAVDGVISIIATFLHTDFEIQSIMFAQIHIDKTFGDANFTEVVTGQLGAGTITYTSSNESVATVTNTGLVTIVGAGSTTITATIAECATHASATEQYILAVSNAPQPAPTGLGKTDETIAGANDGTITGVTTAMEYRLNTTATYTPVTGTTITGLAPGTYHIRYAAKANHDVSEDTVVVIAAGTVPTYIATVNDSHAATTGAGQYEEGKIVTINAGTLDGYTFGGWTVVSGGAALASLVSATTTFEMPANAVAVTANWTPVEIPCNCASHSCDDCRVGRGWGDVDGDGVITSADVTMLRRFIAASCKDEFMRNNRSFTLANANVDGSSEFGDYRDIDAADVTLLRRWIASSTKFPLGPQ
jgi:uncharacterized repeat protein (TIGR02543 family)